MAQTRQKSLDRLSGIRDRLEVLDDGEQRPLPTPDAPITPGLGSRRFSA